MYAVVVADRENFRFRLKDPGQKNRWVETCSSRRMKQQQMMEALIGWFLASPSNVESVLRHDREARSKAAQQPKRKAMHLDGAKKPPA